MSRLTYRGRSVASLRSPSGTPSATATASAFGTGSAARSASGSSAGTPLPTMSPPATRTSSPPRTASPTVSATPTPPVCRGLPAVRLLTGTSGVSPPLSTVTAGQPGMYTAGTCATGLRAFYPGTRLLYSLYLGLGTPLGGTLTLTTCGHTINDTVLYVGTGCPSWERPFACVAGNDDAPLAAAGGGGGCAGGNARASTVAVVVTQPTYYVQLGGMNGGDVVSGLGWGYTPPASRSASGSRTRSRSRSRSGSRSATRSRSRKRKL